MLEVRDVHSFYGLAKALSGISLTLPEGSMSSLIGPNGAGKTTTIHSICGFHRISNGKVLLDSQEITGMPPESVRGLGIATAPEGRRLFSKMTVLENLLMGAYLVRDKKQINDLMTQVSSLFPTLKERKKQLAGSLSGGEQQMLTIGRALMSNPKIILADEISFGLAPLVIQEVYRALKIINQRGVSMLIVEQQATAAFRFTSYVYLMEQGRITLEGKPEELMKYDLIVSTYLGE